VCLRTAKPPFHAAPLVSASYDASLHIRRSHVSPPDRAKAAVRAAPSAPNQSTRPPQPHQAFEVSRLIRLPPCTRAYPTRDASDPSAPSAPKVCILRDRRWWETRLQNNTHIIRAASMLSLNPYCILGKNPFSSAARSWQPGRPWRNASEGHIPQQ
jgi:hypothetical protein